MPRSSWLCRSVCRVARCFSVRRTPTRARVSQSAAARVCASPDWFFTANSPPRACAKCRAIALQRPRVLRAVRLVPRSPPPPGPCGETGPCSCREVLALRSTRPRPPRPGRRHPAPRALSPMRPRVRALRGAVVRSRDAQARLRVVDRRRARAHGERSRGDRCVIRPSTARATPSRKPMDRRATRARPRPQTSAIPDRSRR